MIVSSRSILALGLGVVGVGLLVGPSLGQQDGSVQRSANQSAAAAATSKPPAPVTIGTIDMGVVFKSYDKVKAIGEEFQAAALVKKNELMKILTEAQSESEVLAKLTPGSVDFKKHEDRITQLKAKHDAEREQAQRDFTLREAEMYATIYKEVQDMVARIAQYRSLSYIVRVSNDPVSAANPNSVFAAIEKTVVYADTKSDITRDVVHNLNLNYKRAGGVAPKGTAAPAAGISTPPGGN